LTKAKKGGIIALLIEKTSIYIMLFGKKSKDESWAHKIFGATLGGIFLGLFEIAQIIVIAAVIIVPVRYFLVQPFIVKGASMEGNFHDSDYLIIDEVSFKVRDIKRGEVIVFRPPNAEQQFYIKRVIGLPGETVEIVDGVIKIYNTEYPNGVVVTEDYINEYTSGHERVTLGLDEYFVMGDNRDASLDSRKFGPIKADSITGRVWIRGLPLETIGTITNPEYNF